MASTAEETMVRRYYFRVSKMDEHDSTNSSSHINEEIINAKPTVGDFFRLEIVTTLRHLSTYHSRPRVMSALTTLFESTIRVGCKSFFGPNQQDFLLPLCSSSPHISHQGVVQIAQRLKPRVQQMFHIESLEAFNINNDSDVLTQEMPRGREFPLALDIMVLQEDNESEEIAVERAMILEESMLQGGVRMIPASTKAIQSLKTFALPHKCSICMEKFHGSSQNDDDDDDDDVKLSTMPCGHVFHHHCIVQWLQTSHVCPLCRYPMPIADD